MWATKYDKCIGCGTTTIRHWARGYCNRCYPKYVVRKTGYFNRDNKEVYGEFIENIRLKISARMRFQKSLPSTITQRLNKELIHDLYHEKNMSLGDIAKMFNCSRVHIYNLCNKYGIKVKTKSEARKAAYSSGKKLRYHPVNTNFFKKWSNEMAYVLGFISTDGNIGHRLDVLTISQKEIEILEKIKKVMQAEQTILYYKHHQDIHHLQIGSGEIVRDLLKLGITPNKSLSIKFPEVPDEYVMHFIRGVLDGDGSITSGMFKIGTGSSDFAQTLKHKLITMLNVEPERVRLYKTIKVNQKLPYGRILERESTYYTVVICARVVLEKLYHLLYDNIGSDMYLTRKKMAFERMLKEKDIDINNNKVT